MPGAGALPGTEALRSGAITPETAGLAETVAAQYAQVMADIAELDIALLDAEYENITGGTDDE